MAGTMVVTASLNSSLAAAAGPRAGTFAPTLPSSPPAATALAAPRGRRSARAPLIVRAAPQNKKPDPDVDPTEETVTTTSPGLWDALAFSGPGPERINGRLAMVGFVSALAVEASRGVGLLSQVAGDGHGLAWFAYTAVVLSAASLAPLLQGESVEGRSGGVWTADAELWNGRAAMLGLVALAATEYLTGSPLISA